MELSINQLKKEIKTNKDEDRLYESILKTSKNSQLVVAQNRTNYISPLGRFVNFYINGESFSIGSFLQGFKRSSVKIFKGHVVLKESSNLDYYPDEFICPDEL